MGSYCNRWERETSVASFSSTLLDAIYRSIDEGDEEKRQMKKSCSSLKGDDDFRDSFRRTCKVENWMEKQGVVRRKSVADFERKGLRNDAIFMKSSSSGSSDSSSGGGFSSSEAESIGFGVSSRGFPKPKAAKISISATEHNAQRERKDRCALHSKLKQVKTSISTPQPTPKVVKTSILVAEHNERPKRNDRCVPQPKPKQEGSFMKTKSRALKIYGDLKKVKQPSSPGGRVASFLNSLFASGNGKKTKRVNEEMGSETSSKSANASTCSSASSFSRSCLSKSPSSRGKSSNGTKRSVRFYPISVIVGEDCQPCGEKNLYDEDKRLGQFTSTALNEELKILGMEKNPRADEAARELLRNFEKRRERDFDRRDFLTKNQEFDQINDQDVEEEEEEEEDGTSCGSSDLFELDNLFAIGNGMERYRQELPVYETTRLHSNTAMPNSLIL